MIPMVVTVFGIMILIIGQPPYIQLVMTVVPLVTVPMVDVCSVYRFILVTVYVVSLYMV